MSGYTPVFDSVYDGTLHGKWPTAVVWVSLLPLCDRNGEIRMTVEAIASRTGWPIKLLKKGIEDLMQPDPESQSEVESGRRLVLLDANRSWGWRVVNHGKYREKARKRAHDERRQETGENKDRMAERALTENKELEERPDGTRADPLSYSRCILQLRQD